MGRRGPSRAKVVAWLDGQREAKKGGGNKPITNSKGSWADRINKSESRAIKSGVPKQSKLHKGAGSTSIVQHVEKSGFNSKPTYKSRTRNGTLGGKAYSSTKNSEGNQVTRMERKPKAGLADNQGAKVKITRRKK